LVTNHRFPARFVVVGDQTTGLPQAMGSCFGVVR
jgi:hypothetical protein